MDYETKREMDYDSAEKDGSPRKYSDGRPAPLTGGDTGLVEADVKELQRGLSGFHTSMIAIGGAIGAGLFVSAGGAFHNGGPGSVLIGFMIIAVMMV